MHLANETIFEMMSLEDREWMYRRLGQWKGEREQFKLTRDELEILFVSRRFVDVIKSVRARYAIPLKEAYQVVRGYQYIAGEYPYER
jgi:hypothetical protein